MIVSEHRVEIDVSGGAVRNVVGIVEGNAHFGAAPAAEPIFPQFVAVPDRNLGFVGRSRELADLASAGGDGGATVVCATGLGGIGKTALVVEHCHRSRERFEVMRWLVAAERETLEEVGLALDAARYLGRLDDVQGTSETVVVSAFVYHFNDHNELVLNHEVDQVHWIPLAELARPERRMVKRFEYQEREVELPVATREPKSQ